MSRQAENSVLLRLIFENPKYKMDFFPGQFVQISIPRYGEAPFGVCSSMFELSFFEITVRAVGLLTNQILKLKENDLIGIRGPFGLGYFPVSQFSKRNILIVAGGCGIAPLRSIILGKVYRPNQFKDIQVFYGAKYKDDLYYTDEYDKWKKQVDLHLTVDQEKACKKDVVCEVGLITKLFAKVKIFSKPLVFIVGPPVMAKFVVEELSKISIPDNDIYISMERRMHCGVGTCQHCGIEDKYVCSDGPVFVLSQLKKMRGAL